MKDHLINVYFSDKDDCYIADIPDLKYCSACGTTPEKAVRELMRAKKACLEAARSQGKPIPKPRRRPRALIAKKKD